MAHLPRLNPTLKESKAVGEVSSLVFVFETIQVVLTVFMRDLCHCCLSEGPLGKLSSGCCVMATACLGRRAVSAAPITLVLPPASPCALVSWPSHRFQV